MRMSRNVAALCVAILLAIGWNVGIMAATTYYRYFPSVLAQPVDSVCSTVTPLLDQDTGSLSAGVDESGNYIIAYQDRAHGGRAHIVKHVGNHVEELQSPPFPQSIISDPQFSPPGVKQGSLALVMGTNGRKSRLYYTQRKPDDTTGPYGLWCLEF